MHAMGIFELFHRSDKKTDVLMEKARSAAVENDRAASRLETTVLRLLDAQRGVPTSEKNYFK